MNKFSHTEKDAWLWSRATHNDIEPIMDLMQTNYSQEILGVFTPNRTRMSYNLNHAITDMAYNTNRDLITVAKQNSRLIAWAWLDRGNYLAYSEEEIAGGEFIHLDLTLSIRNRIKLVAQVLEQWEAYCKIHQIPVLSNSSIRAEQTAFMRLHTQMGFTVNGSIAYKRITWDDNESTSNI